MCQGFDDCSNRLATLNAWVFPPLALSTWIKENHVTISIDNHQRQTPCKLLRNAAATHWTSIQCDQPVTLATLQLLPDMFIPNTADSLTCYCRSTTEYYTIRVEGGAAPSLWQQRCPWPWNLKVWATHWIRREATGDVREISPCFVQFMIQNMRHAHTNTHTQKRNLTADFEMCSYQSWAVTGGNSSVVFEACGKGFKSSTLNLWESEPGGVSCLGLRQRERETDTQGERGRERDRHTGGERERERGM